MRRVLLAMGLAAASGPAAAHAVERGLILLLPTEYYLAGGAIAVAVSFLALAALPPRAMTGLFRIGWRRPGVLPRAPALVLGVQTVFFAAWVALVWVGIEGSRDPLSNPLPLVIWAVLWIGFAALVAVAGDLWRWINPWSAPLALIRRVVGPPALSLPTWLGYLPAIAGFGAMVWFEAISLAPDDPARLARAVAIYWLVQLAAFTLFGRRWSVRGEAFSILFRLISRMALLAPGRITMPGAGLIHGRALPTVGWLFIIAMIAGVTFDGLSGTFTWLALIGVNPLEFPGRSAVIVPNTLGLAAVWVALGAAYATAVVAGWALAGRTASLHTSLGRIARSLIPIALAYHLSHYLTYFLVTVQYAMVALSDPFGLGWELLGWSMRPVITSFLADLGTVEVIWQVQTALIVVGHALGVLLADVIACGFYPTRRAAFLSQLPLAVLMVGLTVLGLWLLSAPTVL